MKGIEKNNKTSKIFLSKETLYMLLIFLVCCAVVFTNSYFDYTHFCIRDSIEYLKLAQNLLDGNGYHVPAYGETGNSKELFAIWPVGYPTLIYLVAKVTSLPVLWASKVLNLVIVALIMAVFHHYFKKDAYLYSMLLLLYVPNAVFSSTLSEAPYILGLIIFTFSIWKLFSSPQANLRLYFYLFVSFLLAFLSRYTGFILCGLMGIFAGYLLFFEKRLKDAFKLGLLAGVSLCFMMLYFFYNFQETGYTSGFERTARTESLSELILMYITALNMQICLFASTYPTAIYLPALLTQFLIVRHFFSNCMQDFWKNYIPLFNNSFFKICGVVAIVYYAGILGIRAVHSFHLLHPRLLYPGALVFLIGVLYSLRRQDSEQMKKALERVLMTLVILSILTSTIILSLSCYYNPKKTYKDEFDNLNTLYQGFEKDSIIVFGMKHMNYRHLHVQIRQPREYPFYGEPESWEDFLKRARSYNRPLYLLTPFDEISYYMFHPTVAEVLKSFEPGTLVDLNNPDEMTIVEYKE